MAYLHKNGGRFLTVLPRTRAEDAAFRATVRAGAVVWRQIHVKRDEHGTILDEFSIASTPMPTAEGYRLVWYHSTLKAACDAASRLKRLERVVARLDELRQKLASPRTRYRARAQVSEAVEAIVRECDVAGWVTVEVKETTRETYRQERRGRPGENDAVHEARADSVRDRAPRRAGTVGRGGAVRRRVPAGEQRPDDDGTRTAAGRTNISRRSSGGSSN